MELRGALAGLRHEGGEWTRGQQALAKALSVCRREPAVAPVLAAFKSFAGGAALDACRPLAALFGPGDARAQAFCDSVIAAGLAAIDGHPLGQLPLQHGTGDAASVLVLARARGATLALGVYDGEALAAFPAPRTVRFRSAESWKRVLSGCGTADRIRTTGGLLEIERIALIQGTVHHRQGEREALEVRSVEGALVVLRLEREADDPQPVREVSLVDGALVHRAGARREDSRDELVVALLGRMERIDAVPRLAAVALGGGADALRWRALCEVISLDGPAGVELLAQVAADGEDPLAHQSGTLLRDLLASRPELREGLLWPG